MSNAKPSRDSAGVERGFATIADGQAEALQEAAKRNAVYLP